MKFNKHLFIALALSVATVITLSGCSSNAKATTKHTTTKTTITAITDGNVAPFAVKQKDGTINGYDANVLKAIVKKLPQYKLEWKLADYEALLGNIDSGRADIRCQPFWKNA